MEIIFIFAGEEVGEVETDDVSTENIQSICNDDGWILEDISDAGNGSVYVIVSKEGE